MNKSAIHGLLERYVLGCIGFLPVELEAYISRRVQQTYRQTGDWKAILRGVLRLDEGVDNHLRQRWDAYQKQAARLNKSPAPEEFAKLALEDECFTKLLNRAAPPIPKVLPPPPWGAQITVKAVGFWRHVDGNMPQYPRPQNLVRPGWGAHELKKILGYLRSGYDAHPDFKYCGWSTCRFEYCDEGRFNGSLEFTDGEWGWPEGLAHYAEQHAVILPDEFVNTMRANQWSPPPSPTPPNRTNFDDTFRVNWAAAWKKL